MTDKPTEQQQREDEANRQVEFIEDRSKQLAMLHVNDLLLHLREQGYIRDGLYIVAHLSQTGLLNYTVMDEDEYKKTLS